MLNKQDAIADLRESLKPGDVVYTILRHTSKSGMSRSISLVIVEDGEIRDISYHAASAMESRMDNNHGGIKTGGCGMDMGFHLVYSLGRTLFPEGFASRIGATRDGGYALTHRWL